MATQSYEERPMTGWAGWSMFAATMMILSGGLNALYGLVAAVNDDWVVWRNANAVYFDLSTWGWVHMVVGLVVVAAGIGVLSGNVIARAIGVLMAVLSIVANFFFIPVYPFWAISIITVDALVIWALTAHGGELRRSD